jgi:hypothetical protein
MTVISIFANVITGVRGATGTIKNRPRAELRGGFLAWLFSRAVQSVLQSGYAIKDCCPETLPAGT